MHKIKAFKEIIVGIDQPVIDDQFKICCTNQQYLNVETIDNYCLANLVNAYQLLDELTDNQQLKFVNCFNLLLYRFIKFCGSGAQFIANNNWQPTYRLLNYLYTKKYGKIFSTQNFLEFNQQCLTAFSPIFQQLVKVSTGKSINESAIFCSQTGPNRYALQNNFFKKRVLPDLIKNKKEKNLKLIWLGSSRGDTLYDIYKILNQFSLPDWQITLTACDISMTALELLKNKIWQPLQTKAELIILPTVLGRKEDMEKIFSQQYDIVFMQNVARYLRDDIVSQYAQKLDSNYIFTTFDFQPVNYRLLTADIYQKITENF